MKKGVILLLISFLFCEEITIINGTKKCLDLNELDKYSYTIDKKSSFDSKKYKYNYILLSKLTKLLCPNSRKITFYAKDEYKISFDKKEIDKNNIIFAYKINSKLIPLSKKGPAKIIYLYDVNPIKEIFMIDRIKCD